VPMPHRAGNGGAALLTGRNAPTVISYPDGRGRDQARPEYSCRGRSRRFAPMRPRPVATIHAIYAGWPQSSGGEEVDRRDTTQDHGSRQRRLSQQPHARLDDASASRDLAPVGGAGRGNNEKGEGASQKKAQTEFLVPPNLRPGNTSVTMP
jgi:hypothetical protein